MFPSIHCRASHLEDTHQLTHTHPEVAMQVDTHRYTRIPPPPTHTPEPYSLLLIPGREPDLFQSWTVSQISISCEIVFRLLIGMQEEMGSYVQEVLKKVD